MAAAGGVSDGLVCLTDLLATCADLVGTRLEDDAGEDSVSTLPVPAGERAGKSAREAAICQALREVFAVRQGNWKLILGRGSGGFLQPRAAEIREGRPAGQLYNRKEDPTEAKNLYTDHPDIVRQLTEVSDRCVRDSRSRPRQQSS